MHPVCHYLSSGQAEGFVVSNGPSWAGVVGSAHEFCADFYPLNNTGMAGAAIGTGGDSSGFTRNYYTSGHLAGARDLNAVFVTDGYLNL